MANSSNKTPNKLIHETSPYLLQHAYNPVNWLPFGEEAFELAKKENKPLLISIGYSACHWCHVMEHESFEDEAVAGLMNKHFINVKVDREERGDVDMLYKQAVQLMTGRGGWPLNCFALPDGSPFYGGTYFPKKQWLTILENLAAIYKNDPAKVSTYAAELTEGIKKSELLTTSIKEEKTADFELLKSMVAKWKTRMDFEYGGPNRAPKFPLPSNYKFLLRYALLQNDAEVLEQVHTTLTKMAFGGIYDQLHGGFARYSTDTIWKVPHFEKMLYDNAQLISLYTEAYNLTKNELYKEIALGTLQFVKDEWYQPEGFFYSAYDADSDGEEGKYYVWNKEDLQDLLGADYGVFSKFYLINDTGYWEQGNYILMRSENLAALQLELNLNREELQQTIERCKVILKQEVKSRIKPGLDDKTITSWNAMMCSACAQAYLAFGDEQFREMAIKSSSFIQTQLTAADGRLWHTYKNGKSKVDGFLEDYAFTIEAFINVYLITQNEDWLHKANKLCALALTEFDNSESALLFYTGKRSQQLVARTSEISDNVVPASNSQMANNLHLLGIYFNNEEWISRAEKMLQTVLPEMLEFGSGYSNWACMALHFIYPAKEVAIVGNNVNEKLLELYQHALTNTILAANAKASELPLLKNRWIEGQTLIYVCENNTCQLPVNSVEEAIKLLA
ncbi:MAG: thioredoxin domain-containing protein [Bacteroidia bacterium]|nr:thioredoxin domain-containing protein [Bacteroidia bacterium]